MTYNRMYVTMSFFVDPKDPYGSEIFTEEQGEEMGARVDRMMRDGITRYNAEEDDRILIPGAVRVLLVEA